MYILLLTACINPDGMSFTKIANSNERLLQYTKALNFYLQSTTLPIVFTENSNTDISDKYQDYIASKRLEILTFQGNQDKARGKGYGESEIINYTIQHSQLLSDDHVMVKITGRLIVNNLDSVLREHFPFQNTRSITCSTNEAFNFADSRIIMAPLGFYRTFLLHRQEINDSIHSYFENILANCIIKEDTIPYFPFWEEPSIIGISGSTGEIYEGVDTSFTHRIHYKLHALRQYFRYNKITHKSFGMRLIALKAVYVYYRFLICFT